MPVSLSPPWDTGIDRLTKANASLKGQICTPRLMEFGAVLLKKTEAVMHQAKGSLGNMTFQLFPYINICAFLPSTVIQFSTFPMLVWPQIGLWLIKKH